MSRRYRSLVKKTRSQVKEMWYKSVVEQAKGHITEVIQDQD